MSQVPIPDSPDWVRPALRRGLQQLVCLSLDGTPSADLIAGTLIAWERVICNGRRFDRQRDEPRFDAAFLALAARCRRWPAPVDFIEALPRIIQPLGGAPRIRDDARRGNGMQHIAQIAERLRVAPTRPHAEVDDEPEPAA